MWRRRAEDNHVEINGVVQNKTEREREVESMQSAESPERSTAIKAIENYKRDKYRKSECSEY